jgi:hypothetical protein
MVIFAGLSVCLLILTALFVAIKTSVLWLRTRGVPELLLSLMLLCATVLGYPLTIASSRIPPTELWGVHVASQVAMGLGFACLLLFTLKVFRPGSVWAWCLVGVSLAMIVGAAGVYIGELSRAHPRRPFEMVGLVVFASTPIAIAYFWTTLESLGHYRQLRRRLRLGLCEVVVANRMLLWGLMATSAGLAVVLNVGAAVVGAYLSPPVVLVSSILGVAHASCLFLAFHPPAWYRLWLEGSQEMAAA